MRAPECVCALAFQCVHEYMCMSGFFLGGGGGGQCLIKKIMDVNIVRFDVTFVVFTL